MKVLDVGWFCRKLNSVIWTALISTAKSSRIILSFDPLQTRSRLARKFVRIFIVLAQTVDDFVRGSRHALNTRVPTSERPESE